MAIVRETKPEASVKEPARLAYRSKDELSIRTAVERWGRAKWPDARVVHELVMDRGNVRADIAFVGVTHFAAIEIKSGYDKTDRLLQQAGMFRLASPEVWIVVAGDHIRDAELIRYLMPSIGIATTAHDGDSSAMADNFVLVEAQQSSKFQPVPEAMLCLLWVAELHAEAMRHRLWQHNKPPAHRKLIEMMLKLSAEEQIAAVCRQLARETHFGEQIHRSL